MAYYVFLFQGCVVQCCLFDFSLLSIAVVVVCIVMKYGLIDINIDTHRMTPTRDLQNA